MVLVAVSGRPSATGAVMVCKLNTEPTCAFKVHLFAIAFNNWPQLAVTKKKKKNSTQNTKKIKKNINKKKTK
jgi:hypothetical protein